MLKLLFILHFSSSDLLCLTLKKIVQRRISRNGNELTFISNEILVIITCKNETIDLMNELTNK